jgi:hypothetical protein
MIATEFPVPDRLVRHAFGQLRVARSGTDAEKAAHLGDVKSAALPRPWDPPSCPPTLRLRLWVWLDRVAGWINHEYTWQFDRMIPGCWPAHPHIAHELAVLACLRYDAGHSLSPDALEDWHRYALPGFLDRMAARLGSNPCPPGKHTDWPSSARYKDFESAAAVQRRRRAFTADTNAPDRPAVSIPATRNGRAGLRLAGTADQDARGNGR